MVDLFVCRLKLWYYGLSIARLVYQRVSNGTFPNMLISFRETRVPDNALVYNDHNARWNISKMYGHILCKTKSYE